MEKIKKKKSYLAGSYVNLLKLYLDTQLYFFSPSKEGNFIDPKYIYDKTIKLNFLEYQFGVRQSPGRPGFNPRSSHTKDSKNGT